MGFRRSAPVNLAESIGLDDNPYAPSLADLGDALVRLRSRVTLHGVYSTFDVNGHVIEAFCSHWLGKEVYKVDGKIHSQYTSWFAFKGKRGFRGIRTIELTDPPTLVEIHIQTAPIWLCEVHVDKRLYIKETAPGLKRFNQLAYVALGVMVVLLTAATTALILAW
jgi:hypothetical protein